MHRTVLDLSTASWTLHLEDADPRAGVPEGVAGAAIPAAVPGCSHTDLLAAGLIPDPYLGENEPLTHWVGLCGWRYEGVFHLSEEDLNAERVDLAFDGLDTIAVVSVNGEEVGRSEDMHVRRRFPAEHALRPGENRVTVVFAAPQPHAEASAAAFGPLPLVGPGSNEHLPHNMIRKMACSFGWDWGPRVASSGIWRPARIEAWSTARIADVRPAVVSAGEALAEVDVAVDTEGSPDARVRLTLTGPGGEAAATAEGLAADTHRLHIENPQRWWPRGHGEQPLYTLKVELLTAAGETLDRREHAIGLRTAELVTSPDAPAPVDGLNPDGVEAETFHLRVNGKRIFCMGANWIPDDCFPHRVTPERYAERIDQAAAAHMNMLRVWGGGTFEDHAFYAHCDRIGMLVWQDFLMACACYPEEEPFASLIAEEARDNVARLAHHPSLVLWNGCNENIWGTFDWAQPWVDLREGTDPRTWGLGYYLGVFPRVVEELAPATPYWPGSPYSGSMDRHPNANEYGNRHVWDVWNGDGDLRNYLGHAPRFASEFGYQGPPTHAVQEEAVPAGQRRWLSDAANLHNKQKRGQQRALDRIADDFDGDFSGPKRWEDAHFLATVQQCRALELGCTWFRALNPWCSGILYWQLNDCWPVTSWAAIDGRGNPKPLLAVTERFFRPRMTAVLPAAVTPSGQRPDRLAVYLHNDTDGAWEPDLQARHVGIDGRDLDPVFEVPHAGVVGPRSSVRFLLPEQWGESPDSVVVVRDACDPTDPRGWWFAGRDREIPYREASLEAAVESSGGEHRMTVTASAGGGVVRDLFLLADRLSPAARVSRQAVHLLPGESTTFAVTGLGDADPAGLTRPGVLRCVNGFGARGPGVRA